MVKNIFLILLVFASVNNVRAMGYDSDDEKDAKICLKKASENIPDEIINKTIPAIKARIEADAGLNKAVSAMGYMCCGLFLAGGACLGLMAKNATNATISEYLISAGALGISFFGSFVGWKYGNRTDNERGDYRYNKKLLKFYFLEQGQIDTVRKIGRYDFDYAWAKKNKEDLQKYFGCKLKELEDI